MNILKLVVPALAGLLFITACKSQKFKTHESGLQYQIHDEHKGRKPKVGDVVTMNIDFYKPDSTKVFSTSGQPPIEMQVQKPEFTGDFMEGLTLLSEGDSATFLVSSDSMEQLSPQKGFFEPGTFMRYEVKLLKVQSEEEFKKAKEEEAKLEKEKQAKQIEEYAKANNLDVQKTESGLYYVITKAGTGVKPNIGDKVSVHYTGTLLDGTKFDSSRDRGQPFEFTLGRDPVIKGWEEGLQLLNEGSSAKLLIPSHLGYGQQGAGGSIPPNAILLFDVELMKVGQ